MATYPKSISLKDNTKVDLRPLIREDRTDLKKYFSILRPEDRLYLRDDVTNPSIVDKWIDELNYDKVFPLLAIFEDRIVAIGTLHINNFGWMRFVGEIRLSVAKDFQRKGLGTIIVSELVQKAMNKGLHFLQTSFSGRQAAAIKAFENVGFIKNAVLRNLVVDINNNESDLVIMTNDVNELWKKIEDSYFDSDLRNFENGC